jgi:DnaD/phage-associated family protein
LPQAQNGHKKRIFVQEHTMEAKAEYHVDEIADANEMIGKGYEHPSLEIHPATEVISRRNGRMVEEKTPAFVKISTNFKAELPNIDEISLKVWLYIALSVNRFSGKAYPGLRTICEGTGLSINTVRAAIDRLENKYALLTVDKGTARYNIYEPLAFVSANRTPTSGVSADDTVTGTVSVESETVSVLSKTVFSHRENELLNQINQIKPDSTTAQIFKVYSNEIYPITAAVADRIGIWIDDPQVDNEWIVDAIKEASIQNKRNWSYCEAILKRWKLEGRKPMGGGKTTNRQARLMKQLETA